jgi:glycosyltransferase involved in cell wall biosynthesis
MPPLVSILIPVYNAQPWVSRAIESALNQTWPRVEVIVLDDRSTDGSWEAVSAWAGKVRVERATKNGGQNVSRNHLTSMSQGEWLAYLDADDELLPDAVEKKMALAENADCIYGTVDLRFHRGQDLLSSKKLTAVQFDDPMVGAFEWKYPNTSSVMFRRSALKEAGGWNENIQNCTDYELYFRMLLAGKRFVAAPESVTIYRQWSIDQAVYQAPMRKMSTRLSVMWEAVTSLERSGRFTPALREAFGNSALSVIRTMYPVDAGIGLAEQRKLRNWHPKFSPSRQCFPRHYCLAYDVLGFRGAEFLARATRILHSTSSSGLHWQQPANAPAS